MASFLLLEQCLKGYGENNEFHIKVADLGFFMGFYNKYKKIGFEITRKRGHVISAGQREFTFGNNNALVTTVRYVCTLCGAPLIVTDDIRIQEEDRISGSAFKYNCKFGAIPIEPFKKQIWHRSNEKELKKKKKENFIKLYEKYGIDEF